MANSRPKTPQTQEEEPSEEQAAPEEQEAPKRRMAWQLELLESNKRGDCERLRAALEMPKADINTRTLNGGYGGYRYVTWGETYGGDPEGETLLHLALRPEAAQYGNRREYCEALIEVGIDASIRNARDQTGRDVNRELFDLCCPMKNWSASDGVGWLTSAGNRAAVDDAEKWVAVFGELRLDGKKLLALLTPQDWHKWVNEHLSDLTRAGISAESIEQGRIRWANELKTLRVHVKTAASERKATRKKPSPPPPPLAIEEAPLAIEEEKVEEEAGTAPNLNTGNNLATLAISAFGTAEEEDDDDEMSADSEVSSQLTPPERPLENNATPPREKLFPDIAT